MFGNCLLPLVFAAAALPAFAATKPAIVAYVFPQDAALAPTAIDATRLTRINYAFANIKNGRMVTGFTHDSQNFATLLALKKRNPDLTVLVSVGGWSWSGGFTDIALTARSRALFIDSVVAFLTQYNLDGLDIDWEYPGLPGDNHRFRAEDKENFTKLLQELRSRFDRQPRQLYLTIAAGASNEFLAHTDMAEVQKYLDTVNLMTYDFYTPSPGETTGNHAALFTDPADPRQASADASVQAFEAAGVPPEKIVLGVPFYGHVWGNVPPAKNGLFQSGDPVPNTYAPFSVITSDMLGHGYTRYWDSVSSVPYLYNPQKKIFVSYEDVESLTRKSAYVLDKKLGGMMFWEYTNDASGKLLDAIATGLNHGAAAH